MKLQMTARPRALSFSRHANERGLSLAELLIALALTSSLILGIFTVYMDSNRSSQLANSLARVQESARIAFDVMARDMRMIGFQGCADPRDVALNIIADNPPTADFFETTLRAWEVDDADWAAGTEFDNTTIESRAVIGSDAIAVQRGDTIDIELTGNMSADNANVQVVGSEVDRFGQNDLVLISDCEAADLFRISSTPSSGTWAHANNVNSTNRLSQAYTESAQVFQFSSSVYFVGDTGRDDVNGNDIRALYRANDNLDNAAAASFSVDELVEGVESMQIEYGEILNSGNIRYETADNVGDFQNVVAVRLGLLVSNAENAIQNADDGSYDLPGETIVPVNGAAAGAVTHPGDRRLRRVFTTTVMLRNRD